MSEISCGIEDEEIIFQEILPRLPVKSLFRFKVVSKKWLNFLTHDPVFPIHHHNKSPNTTTYFSTKSGIFYSSDDHFNWSKPSFMRTMSGVIIGSTNGLIYGHCCKDEKMFICNPITKHAVFVPKPLFTSSVKMGLACDSQNPTFGFTIVCPVSLREETDGTELLQFQLYSSKMGEWRVSESASEFRVPCNWFMWRNYQAAYPGNNRVYFSLLDYVMWFDIENDVAGLIRCPGHPDFLPPQYGLCRTEIGVCNGELTYTKMTKQGDVDIWFLMDKDNNNVIEWAKKHTVGLLIIVEENWNTMFVRICKDMITEEGMNAAQLLVGATALPYTGGDEVWFLINAFSRVKMKAFSFNLRTHELKLVNKDGRIAEPFCPFVPTLLPCPT